MYPQVTAASGAVQIMQMQDQAKRQFAVRLLRITMATNGKPSDSLPQGMT